MNTAFRYARQGSDRQEDTMSSKRSNLTHQSAPIRPEDDKSAAVKRVDQEGWAEDVLTKLLEDEAVWGGTGADPDWDLAKAADWILNSTR